MLVYNLIILESTVLVRMYTDWCVLFTHIEWSLGHGVKLPFRLYVFLQ